LSIPIQRLTTLAEEISRGKINPQISYANRKDEIGALARAIERLSTSIRLAIKRLSQGVKKPAKAS
jgi:methyl-accepting chemotaxis protein